MSHDPLDRILVGQEVRIRNEKAFRKLRDRLDAIGIAFFASRGRGGWHVKMIPAREMDPSIREG